MYTVMKRYSLQKVNKFIGKSDIGLAPEVDHIMKFQNKFTHYFHKLAHFSSLGEKSIQL
jgi:hypothetical protein